MNQELLTKLAQYKTPQVAIDLINRTKVVFLVGISGAGKDTILKELLKTGEYSLIISHTTRRPRENHGVLEQDGVDYHFVDFNEINAMLERHEFVEAKHYSGNVYGTSVAEIQKAHDAHKIAISDIEVQGIAEYKDISESVTPIFILPPDFATWQERFQHRYGESANPHDVAARIETAKQELQHALEKPYFEYVVNQDLVETVKVVNEIAHGNFSTAKNEQAKKVAEQLLVQLQ